jgi:hypothetical protein
MSATLTATETKRYRQDGVLFPVPALTPGEATRFRTAFEEVITRLGGRPTSQDLLSIFAKYPRDPGYISWHQDGTYWGLDSSQVTTAWVALTDSVIENGCMRVVPGSHTRAILPHKDTYAPDYLLSRGQEVEADVDEQDAVDVVLEAGQMSLHHVNIIHGSNPNPSERPRYGFAIRFTTPTTKQIDGEPPTAVLARGRDDYHHFRLLPAPPALSMDAALVAQQAEARRLLGALRKTTGHYAAGGA